MKIYYTILTLLCSLAGTAQQRPMSSADILQALHKLNTLGSVLYVAAHPDDENTRLIAWFAGERHVRTAYLSVTRGDGGQNLVGTEQGDLLGVLRTQELLEARKIDGGEQLFTRAIDFGYSKSAEETMKVWGRDVALADVVWAIRRFRPDVVITRFPEPDSTYTGHGHHSASALLARDAFYQAANSAAYTPQLAHVTVWQPKRLLHNASTWWIKDLVERAKNSDDILTVDVGAYNAALGRSYTEIAGESRSMHKSQGFGAARVRGTQKEYLQHRMGDKAPADVFDGIDITWNRVKGGAEIGRLVGEAIKTFRPDNPSDILPQLLAAYQLVKILEDAFWREVKRREIEDLILACTGTWLEAAAKEYGGVAGATAEMTLSALNRSSAGVILVKAGVEGSDTALNIKLADNAAAAFTEYYRIPARTVSQPYWLAEDAYTGSYKVTDQRLTGTPENAPALNATFTLNVSGTEITYSRPVVYRWTDRVEGELYRPFLIIPAVTAAFGSEVYVITNGSAKEVRLTLTSQRAAAAEGSVRLTLPAGWKCTPASQPFRLDEGNAAAQVAFTLQAPAQVTAGSVSAAITLDGKETATHSMVTVDYGHITVQTLMPRAHARLVSLDAEKQAGRIGYIMGAGDEVPQCLEQLGYAVEMLGEEQVIKNDLRAYDAIITGVRAYNTEAWLAKVNAILLGYVKDGGTLIVQYNTERGLVTEDIGPYPFRISRRRVTVEEAPAAFAAADHALLHRPNRITETDFSGWVQERGLYFADQWDDRYTAPLSWADPGEEASHGALIAATYGKGSFIYTGIAFFRQLPAGVPGAYRLFVNMISYGNGAP